MIGELEFEIGNGFVTDRTGMVCIRKTVQRRVDSSESIAARQRADPDDDFCASCTVRGLELGRRRPTRQHSRGPALARRFKLCSEPPGNSSHRLPSVRQFGKLRDANHNSFRYFEHLHDLCVVWPLEIPRVCALEGDSVSWLIASVEYCFQVPATDWLIVLRRRS